MFNAMHNISNPAQGPSRKVLCVCSAGLLRSPTAALTLASVYGYNTRAAGVSDEYALIPVTPLLLCWADEIVVMEGWQEAIIKTKLKDLDETDTPVYTLNVPDKFMFNSLELRNIILEEYKRVTGGIPANPSADS